MTNILYTRTTDSQSKLIKLMLARQNITFEERNLDSKAFTVDDLKADAPDAKKIPVLIMDGTVIGGVKAFNEYSKANAPAKKSPSNAQNIAKNALKKP